MTDLARIEVERRGDVMLARLTGEVDLSNVDEIRLVLADQMVRDLSCLLLDLTETTYLDSTGVRLLFELAEQLQSRRQELRLVVSDTALVRRVLVLTHIGEQVPFHASVPEALEALDGPSRRASADDHDDDRTDDRTDDPED